MGANNMGKCLFKGTAVIDFMQITSLQPAGYLMPTGFKSKNIDVNKETKRLLKK